MSASDARRRGTATLSVVVPTLDEAEHLPALLRDLEGLDAETVVVDGGSVDGTPEIARDLDARVVSSRRGRGPQLRAGAKAASGDWLFFVHADCRLDAQGLAALRSFVRSASPSDFAHFHFALDGDAWIHAFIELGQGLRERWLGLVYGDQGLVVSRALYDRAGGYPDWPLMEDVGLIRELERHGRRVTLPATLTTSARRYDEEGGLRRWMRNVALMSAFRLGVPPRVLARWYRPRRGRRAADHPTAARPEPRRAPAAQDVRDAERARIVGVFAKAPEPGRVKTRLAADVGAERAAQIYRTLGRATVEGLRGGAYRTIVFVDPPGAAGLDAARAWLGSRGLEYRPQSDGDLGARMSAALEECLEEGERALLVGTDIPGIDRKTVEAAFEALADHDVVVGPATDGGYYLVGMSRLRPELFAGVAWSTDRVLEQTLARAERARLSVALLEAKTDVDTVADLPSEPIAEA